MSNVKSFLLLLITLFALPAFSQTISVNPTSGKGVVPVTVSWDPQSRTGCTLSGGALSGPATAAGSSNQSVNTTTTYSISCPATGGSVANLTWTKPLLNTDGSTLTDGTGYKIYWGTSLATVVSPTNLTAQATVTGINTQSFVTPTLAVGTWYFAISTTATGGEGPKSNSVSLVVAGTPAKTVSATVTVTPLPNAPTAVTATEVIAYEIRRTNHYWYLAAVGTADAGVACYDNVYRSFYVIDKVDVDFRRRSGYRGGTIVAKCVPTGLTVG